MSAELGTDRAAGGRIEALRFVALGDSVTVGIGDRVDGTWRGWAALLAQSLASSYAVSFTNLAGVGATAARVRSEQLPVALRLRPRLASLIVGINDTMRSTYDPARLRADVMAAADALVGAGASLLLVRFHDHGRVFGLPAPLRRPLARRIATVNAIYDEVHATYGGHRVDLSANPDVYSRAAWSVDRLHPSERGHRWLARSFAETLSAGGIAVARPPCPDSADGQEPSVWRDVDWMVRKGVPWAARRAGDLAPWLVRLAVGEAAQALRGQRTEVGRRSVMAD